MNISKKILLSSTISLLVFGLFTIYWSLHLLHRQGEQGLQTIESALIREKQEKIKNIVESAWSLVNEIAQRRDLTTDQQQKLASDTLRAMRYGHDEYLWINDLQATMIMHPTNPTLEGQDLTNSTDANGQPLFRKFVEVSRQDGEGLVTYAWKRPGGGEALTKLSYVKLFQPWNWVIGTGIFIEDVNALVQQQQESMEQFTGKEQWRFLVFVLAALLVVGVGVFLLSRRISAPIIRTGMLLQEIAEGDGDLTRRLAIQTQDEIGQMSRWFDIFISKLHTIVRNILEYFETVTASANQLLHISKNMDDGVHRLDTKASNVADSAKKMSQSMNEVAHATQEAAENLTQVKETMEAMKQMVGEIGDNSNQTRAITNKAVAEAKEASSKIDALGEAASNISKVTEVINEISDQTNLLALNATIEAARAGEAGKGFAVVANEIKELARQTATATGSIRQEIEGVRRRIDETVVDVTKIAEVIGEVDQTVSTITDSVAEQTASTNDMVEILIQMTYGIEEVYEKIAQSSASFSEIASEVTEVSGIARTLTGSSEKVNQSAGDLTRLAADLKQMIGEFKVDQSSGPLLSPGKDSSELISWNKDIEFNIESIDKQHHHLVDLVNDLHRAMRNRKGKAVLGTILDELTRYTVEHFQAEEKLMAQYHYPHLTAHKREHERLIKEVVAFKKQFEAGSATVTLDLMNFLSDWLINHIKGMDRLYVPTLKDI